MFLGQHTLSDLKDFISAKDVEVADLNNGFSAIQEQWASTDNASASDFQSDLTNLISRYNSARLIGQTKIDGNASVGAVSPTVVPAEVEWNGVVVALRQNGDLGALAKGDSFDLANRLTAAGGTLAHPTAPQPDAATDVDSHLYVEATDALKNLSTATKIFGAVAAIAILGYGAILLAPIILTARR